MTKEDAKKLADRMAQEAKAVLIRKPGKKKSSTKA